ncbi:MAG: glycosyltransferase family 2 protein [Clostridia bacterium]|nr:glycosyltransferase family 2 protein [Clostridia bacterium]
MPKISFIVPVYNTGLYIKNCLDSIINQTFKEEIEIILIDDGSTDNSDELIKEYIEKNNSKDIIKYYTKENEGIAKTRNFGIDKANGKYIFFVDSDDYIDKETIKKLKPYIDEDIDMIKFKLQRIDKNNNILEKVDGPIFTKISGEEAFNKLYSEDVLLDSPCVYVIKRNLFTKNNFKFNRTYHEDFGLIPLIILKAKSFVSIPDYLYYYVQGENSITRNDDYNKTIKKFEDALYHYDNAIEKIDKMNLNRKSKENAKIFYTNAVILKLYEIKEEDKNKFIKEIEKRKMYKNIKPRNIKQIIKRNLLHFNVKLYLKMR